MSDVFWSSDLHINHRNIIKYCPSSRGRFLSVEEMNDTIINNINAKIQPNDTFYYLGDFIFAGKHDQKKKIDDLRSKINCNNIHMILGNHDEEYYEKGYYNGLFSSIERLQEINIHGQRMVLCHYPLRTWNGFNKGVWNLAGHVHGNAKELLPASPSYGLVLDVGVDVFNMNPISFQELVKVMEEKKKYIIKNEFDHHS